MLTPNISSLSRLLDYVRNHVKNIKKHAFKRSNIANSSPALSIHSLTQRPTHITVKPLSSGDGRLIIPANSTLKKLENFDNIYLWLIDGKPASHVYRLVKVNPSAVTEID
jgi:hypothetical protein